MEKFTFTSRIKSIDIIDFDVVEENFDIPEFPVTVENYQYEFNLAVTVNAENDALSLALVVNIFSDIEKVNNLGSLNISATFITADFKSILQKHNNKIPNPIFETYVNTLISTARGVLIVKAKETMLEGVIIPIINPKTFVADSRAKS